MEVTALLPSFNWKLKLTHFYSRKCEMKLESGKEPHPLWVLYIGPRKRLNDYCALWAKYIENSKGKVVGSNVAHRIDPSIFNLLLT
jgi:hypothetical protein